MYEDIRQLIVENSIREALEATDALGPSGEFRTSLLLIQRRWRLLETQALNQSQHEHLMRVEENQVIEDLIALLDNMETASEEQREPVTEKVPSANNSPVTPRRPPDSTPPKKSNPLAWLLGSVLAIFFLVSLYWMSQKLPQSPAAKPSQTDITEREPRRPVTGEEKPSESEKTTADGISTPGVTLDPAVAERLQERATLDNNRQLTINPDLLNTRLRLFRGNEFMTAGQQVDAGLAFYFNKGSGSTEYLNQVSEEMANLLGQKLELNISHKVLKNTFHANSLRNTFLTRGDRKDKRLTTQRAKYLILVDLRNVKATAELRVCLIDLKTQEAINKRDFVEVDLGSGFPGKDVYYTTFNILKAFADRKLLTVN